MKRLKCKEEQVRDSDIMELINIVKNSEKLPIASDDFEKRVMAQIYGNERMKFPLERLIYASIAALCLILTLLMVFRYTRPAENSYLIPLEDVKMFPEVKKSPKIDVTEAEIGKNQPFPAQNKKQGVSQQKSSQEKVNIEFSYDLKAHIGMELVEVLDETIKAIERGDREWEIEI